MSSAVTATGILISRIGLTLPATVSITSNSVDAVGSIVLTSAPHLLAKYDEVTIAGVTGGTPTINGTRLVTEIIDATHFRINVVTTAGGTGGTVQQTFGTVGEITELDPGGMSRNPIETTTHNDGSESHVLGILRQSDPTFKINYVASDYTHIQILADIAANTKAHWKIKFPSGKTRDGNAYVAQFKFDPAPVDAKQGASLTITWAGAVTEA